MLYYGYFRDINTQVDEKGQLYKFEIITDLENPYPYLPNLYDPANQIPSDGNELTMCSQPFTVQYEGEANNVYKPHKCSTATARFLMSNFNPDLFATYNKKILVALLKWKNNIRLVGDNYVDENNNIVCRKHSYQVSASTVVYKFIPEEVDKLCYDVEWIGFATPNAYNQNYALVEEPFELEAQDAISYLSNTQWSINYELEVTSIVTLINRIIGSLGVYKNIYYTDTHITEGGDQIDKIAQQWQNWKNKNYLEILDGISNYLNLTVFPYQDSVYILDADGVANEHQYYNHRETTGNTRYYFNYNNTWVNRGQKNCGNTLTLTQQHYASNDTNISLEEVYDGVTLNYNDNEITLQPNTLESENYLNYTVLNTERTLFSETVGTEIGNSFSNIVRFKKGVIIQTKPDALGYGYTTYLYNADTVVLDMVMRDTSSETVTTFNYNDFSTKVGCVILQNTELEVEERKTNNFLQSRQDISKEVITYPNTFVFFGNASHGDDIDYENWWWNNNQPVLRLATPEFIRNKYKYLQIKGDFTFFRNGAFAYFTDTDNSRVGIVGDNRDVTIIKKFLYITCRVELNVYTPTTGLQTYYLRKYYYGNSNDDINSAYHYYWDNSGASYNCDIYLDDADIDLHKPFGQTFHFGDAENGFIPELPNTNTSDSVIYQLNFTIYRPLGCAQRSDNVYLWANSAKLENFEIRVVDGFENMNYKDISYTTKQGTEQHKYQIETDLVSLTSTKYGQWGFTTMGGTDDYINTRIFNTSTGIFDIPEKIKIADYFKQYTGQTLRFNTTIFNNYNVTPVTCIKTNQLNGYKFVVDEMQIDYELNRKSLSLVSKSTAEHVPELDIKMYIDNGNGIEPVNNPLWWRTDFLPPAHTPSVYTIESDNAVHSTNPDHIRFEPTFTEEGIFARVTNAETGVTITVNNHNQLIISN